MHVFLWFLNSLWCTGVLKSFFMLLCLSSKALSFEAYFTLKAAKDSLNLGLNLH
ncbi:hypothetical protein BT96DRAFT_284010 [Gymnopus androsaceus JB14]|uniref:Uncharacterized protein n=1 Tax=Gymnopus androsaceus JB14 TaxID=1447944 RepID=A0A6A4I8I5_9AGAR|nr:hypothetical protein BT96DRAFT_284010 [Gymnopus androsaceus JB14]